MANPSPTVLSRSNVGPHVGLHDLATIAENQAALGKSSSPESCDERTDLNDFGDNAVSPKRRSTHPPIHSESDSTLLTGNSPIRDPKLGPPARANTYGVPNRARKYKRFFLNRTKSAENESNPKSSRRASIADTKFSASFEETAIWDHKAILSLDGGGIRGYSALLILRELMKTIAEQERSYPAGLDASDGPAVSSYHPLLPDLHAATDDDSLESRLSAKPPTTASSPWLPCHYFDYIAGTSTGGLISIMLGRLRMSVDDCIEDYETLGEKVFGHSRWFHLRSPLFWIRDKYHHRVLEDVVQTVVRDRVPKVASFPGGQNFAFDENRCRTVVLSYQKQTYEGFQTPYLFRTYKNLHKSATPEERSFDRNPALAHDIPIWKVARATSAAPTYFKPMKIDGLEYLDGGFGANNPCVEIYDEVRKMNNNSDKCASIVLSVGTGKNKKMTRFSGTGLSRYFNYMNFARKWASESEHTHEDMIKKRDHSQHKFHYVRLNVESGLDVMKLDEWRARGKLRTGIGRGIGRLRLMKQRSERVQNGIESRAQAFEKKIVNGEDAEYFNGPEDEIAPKIPQWFQPRNTTLDSLRYHTQTYLESPEVKVRIAEAAKLLVDGRRLRAKMDPERWEKACYGAWYQCRVNNCPRGEHEYPNSRAFRKHLLDKHPDYFAKMNHQEMEKAIDAFKIVVR